MKYFPDYDGKILTERQYMWDMLFTINPDTVVEIIKNARRKRKLNKNDNRNQMIEITPKYKNKISSLMM